MIAGQTVCVCVCVAQVPAISIVYARVDFRRNVAFPFLEPFRLNRDTFSNLMRGRFCMCVDTYMLTRRATLPSDPNLTDAIRRSIHSAHFSWSVKYFRCWPNVLVCSCVFERYILNFVFTSLCKH